MNDRQFIAKQRVKYIWKSLKHTTGLAGNKYRDTEGGSKASFWEYEQTPRNINQP